MVWEEKGFWHPNRPLPSGAKEFKCWNLLVFSEWVIRECCLVFLTRKISSRFVCCHSPDLFCTAASVLSRLNRFCRRAGQSCTLSEIAARPVKPVAEWHGHALSELAFASYCLEPSFEGERGSAWAMSKQTRVEVPPTKIRVKV